MFQKHWQLKSCHITIYMYTRTHTHTHKTRISNKYFHDKADDLSYAQEPMASRSPSVCVFVCVDREQRATLGPPDSRVLLGLQVHRVDRGHLVPLPQVLTGALVCDLTQFLTVTPLRVLCSHTRAFCRSFFSWGKGGNGTSRSTRSL